MTEARMDTYFRQRLQRRFYYGDRSSLDVPSLPLTELAVDYFHESVPEKLGHVDMFSASNLIRRNHVSPCSVVLSMLYAKRLRQQRQQQKHLLRAMSSADVFFISMMMASKYLYDEGVDEEVFNDDWADNTNQAVDEVNQMEADFLQAMDWKLFVQPHEFEDTLAAIERRLALQEGYKRGWFSYTELDALMDSHLLWTVWENIGSECSKLLTAISAAYVTSVLSMMGSTALAIHISGQLSSMTVAVLTLHSSALTPTVYPQPPAHLSHSSCAHVMWLAPAAWVASPPENNQPEVNRSLTWSLEVNIRLSGEFASRYQHVSLIDGHGNGSRETADHWSGVNGSPPPAQSSLWILLSQVWAAICIRVKQAHTDKPPACGHASAHSFSVRHGLQLQQPHSNYQQPHGNYQQPHDNYQQPHSNYQQPHSNYQQPHSNYQQQNAGCTNGRLTLLPRVMSHKDIQPPETVPPVASSKSASQSQGQVCSPSPGCLMVTSVELDTSTAAQLLCHSAEVLLPDLPHRPDSGIFPVSAHTENDCCHHSCTRASVHMHRHLHRTSHASQSVSAQPLTDAALDCQHSISPVSWQSQSDL